MKFKITEFSKAKVGDTVLAKRFNRTVKGEIINKLPGCLVIEDPKLGRVIVDADRVYKVF